MLFLDKLIDVRRLIVVINPSFPSISFYICDLVDAEGMFLVDGRAMYGFARCDGLLRSLVFNKGKPETVSMVGMG